MLSECAQPACKTVLFGIGFCIDCEKLLLAPPVPRPRGNPLFTSQRIRAELVHDLQVSARLDEVELKGAVS